MGVGAMASVGVGKPASVGFLWLTRCLGQSFPPSGPAGHLPPRGERRRLPARGLQLAEIVLGRGKLVFRLDEVPIEPRQQAIGIELDGLAPA